MTFKVGDLAIFIRDSTAAGSYYGEAGEIVTIIESYGKAASHITGHNEYDRNGRRRSWFGESLDSKHIFPFAYHKDLKKLEIIDVGDLEDDL